MGFRVPVPLLILPHAFRDENAFYDPASHSLLFGYFTASRDATGMNFLGRPSTHAFRTTFSSTRQVTPFSIACASVFLLTPTHADVLAFHEGFSDIVAIFQHFTYRDVVADQLRRFPEGFNAQSWIANLAEQFGYARGEARALRTAYVGPKVRLADVTEPHERGGVLVAAVFDAFFDIYTRRTQDLIRIATGGTAASQPETSRPTSRGSSRLSPPRLRSRCSTCASARLSICRPSTSASATTFARS
jgi:hypothetical protein